MKSRALVGVFALVACTEKNPLYCDHDGDCTVSGVCDKTQHTCVALGDAGTDGAPMHCGGDPDCMTPTPHCVDGICRQCGSSTDCTNGQICLPTHACGACSG